MSAEHSTATYIDHEGIVDQSPDRFGRACDIVKTVHNGECPDDDTYVVRFADGYEREVFPEELKPMPIVGFEAQS